MTLLLKIIQKTWLKTLPLDSSQLPANQKLAVTIGESFAPIDWQFAINNHIEFKVTDRLFLYAYIPHISLTQDGVDLLAPKQLVTKEQADYVFGIDTNSDIFKDLYDCLAIFKIIEKEDIAQFLGQIAHESGGLKWLRELATGDDYEGREDLGNTEQGDGRKYKGAGALQLTGRANYQAFADYIGDRRIIDDGVDYVAIHYPISSAGFWWWNNSMSQYIANGATVEQVSTRVNGADPANGLDDRIYYYNRAKEVIK